MKTFHGCIFMNKDELEKAGINHPIKVEYYKVKQENEDTKEYGVEVVKTEYLEHTIATETAYIENVTSNETKANKILEILKKNQVTPIVAEDVIGDLIYE